MTDHDAAANIARMTGQVETLKRERDEWRERHGVLVDDAAALGKRATEAERLKTRWEECANAFERERDAYKRDYDAEIEGAADMRRLYGANANETLRMFVSRVVSERDERAAQLRKSDAQRDELEAMLTACEERETQQRERAKKAEERAGTAEFALRKKEQEAYSSDLHLRERVGVLEEVLRPFVEAHYWECHTQFGPSLKSNPWRRETIEAARTALRPAPPSNAGVACDTAPPAETPAPGHACDDKSCQWRGHVPKSGSYIERHLAEKHPNTRMEVQPVDRDASVDDYESDVHKWTGISRVPRQDEIDRLRAELASANEQAEEKSHQVNSLKAHIGSNNTVIERLKEKLERERAELAAANEQIALLRRKYEHAGCAHGSHCKECFWGDDENAIGHLFRGEWATNEERDQLINQAFADKAAANEEIARLKEREPTNDEMERALAGADEAFLGGTIRRCRICRCAVFGGPTACIRCVERAAHAATTALLGRAVALIVRIGEYGKAWIDAMSETSKVQAKRGAEGVRAFEAEVDAILADADSKAAGEAWRGLMDAVKERCDCAECDLCIAVRNLSNVDARGRGGSNG